MKGMKESKARIGRNADAYKDRKRWTRSRRREHGWAGKVLLIVMITMSMRRGMVGGIAVAVVMEKRAMSMRAVLSHRVSSKVSSMAALEVWLQKVRKSRNNNWLMMETVWDLPIR